jgi:hypothetical protein
MKTLHMLCIGLLGVVFALTSLGCGGASSATANLENEERDRNRDAPSAADSSDGSEFHTRLLKAAREYQSFGLIDNEMNWAPAPCAAPGEPPAPTFSKSDQADSHGSKLYFLFASNVDSYLHAKKKSSPVGQTIVKESWHALPVDKIEGSHYADHASGHQIRRYTSRGDKLYKAGQRHELFVMFKADADTPGTDKGWVYGVVSADAKKVVAAGRLNNCMTCHADAGVDRLFGPKNPPPLPESSRTEPLDDNSPNPS